MRRGELEKGHHIQGLAFGGKNEKINIKNTGESTIQQKSLMVLTWIFTIKMDMVKKMQKY